MNKLYKIWVVILAMTFFAPILGNAKTDEELKSKLPMMLNSSNAGKKFYITVPPPYEEVAGDNFVRIFIISPVAQRVKISNKIGLELERVVQPFKLWNEDLNTQTGIIYGHGTNEPARPAFVEPGKAVVVESEYPIVVYVIVRFRFTSDGYLAIPTTGLGKEYISQTIGPAWANFPTWIAAVGVYDNTRISLTMGGSLMGDSRMRTEDGRLLSAGDRYNFRVNEGDVWLGGASNYAGDISGTKLTANKPFAFFHAQFCNQIPVGTTACDYSIEMPYPTNTWGKTFHIPRVGYRRYTGLINIVAKEPNTNVYRDGKYFTTIARAGGGNDAQGAYHYERLWAREDFAMSRPGVLTADKPIHVTYFNPGSSDDGVQTDPYWMTITPAEQFLNEIVFCTPNAAGGDRYNMNFMNVVFETPNGIIPDDLEWAEYTTANPKWMKFSDYVTQAPLGFYSEPDDKKKYSCVYLVLPGEGVFGLRSTDTKFTCYSFGEASWDSYGYPTAAAFADLEIQDTLAPNPEWVQTCDGNVDINRSKVTDMPFPEPVAERSNMADMGLIPDLSFNYEFLAGEIIIGETITTNWGLRVINPALDAQATVYFIDRAGNDTTIQIQYFAASWEVLQDENFGQFMRDGSSLTKDFTIVNKGKGPLTIKSIDVMNDGGYNGFELVPIDWDFADPIPAGESRIFRVKFTADDRLNPQNITFRDRIRVQDDCVGEDFVTVRASTGEPIIVVSDVDFGAHPVGRTVARRAITIQNEGNADLIITGYTPHNFTNIYKVYFPVGQDFTTPVTIAPGEFYRFEVDFTPELVQAYPDQIEFISNAGTNRDNIAVLNGSGIQASISVNSYAWGELSIQRPGYNRGLTETTDDAYGDKTMTFVNEGTLDARLRPNYTINVLQGEEAKVLESFHVKINNNFVPFSTLKAGTQNFGNLVVPQGQKRTFEVAFRPTEIGPMELEITFEAEIPAGVSITSNLVGYGKAPSARITATHNFGTTLVNDFTDEQNPDTEITLEVFGGAYADDFQITDIQLTNTISNNFANYNGRAFKFDETVIARNANIAPGTIITIPATFVANVAGNINGTMTLVGSHYTHPSRAEWGNMVSQWSGQGELQGSGVTVTQPAIICVDDQVDITVTVQNNGSRPINVTSLDFAPKANYVFWVQTGNNNAIQNIPLAPGETRDYLIRFTPDAVVNQNITVTMTTDELTDNVSTSQFNVTSFDRSAATTSRTNVGNRRLTYGEEFTYTAGYAPNGNAADANVRELNIKFNYSALFMTPFLDPTAVNDPQRFSLRLLGAFANDFEIVDAATIRPQVVNPGTFDRTIEFTVRAKGAAVLGNNASDMFELRFRTFLPASNAGEKIDLTEGMNAVMNTEVTYPNPNGCFNITSPVEQPVGMAEICADDLRPIITSRNNFFLANINPNPVSARGGDIEFGVGFETHTQITIFNTSGQIVATPVNESMGAGDYSFPLPIDELANGVYFYEMKSGPYSEIRKLVIQK